MQPAIFLDRDGVVIENRTNYVQNWSQVKFIEKSLETLVQMSQLPYRIVIITNQAGIGRGIISEDQAAEINHLMVQFINQAGGRIDGLYMCPHTPEDNCACRKPKPGLLYRAAEELEIDLSQSILVGDNLSDIQAGLSAGLSKVRLVRTGLGEEYEKKLADTGVVSTPIFDNLAEAMADLVKIGKSPN
jgi:D-glycero-D-manno-heptose 1,7-bisphosphate phosphatase